MYGLTGSLELVQWATERFNVRFEKIFDPNKPNNRYTVNHTASLFLMGQDGRFTAKFIYGITTDQLAGRLSEIIP